jgi:hypothetical protein
MSRLHVAIDQITHARKYTLALLQTVPPEEWFTIPPGGVSHVGWQVGHLAMAEYRLALERIRGPQPEDPDLIPERFLRLFGRESAPSPDPAANPTPVELRAVLDRVHLRALESLARVHEEDLDSPPWKPHPLFTTKIESLVWCAHHEMLHAGQIGMLRRMLGHPPVW